MVVPLCWSHLQLLKCLGLLHQDWKLPDPEWYQESTQVMFRPTFILSASPFLRDSGRVESPQVLKPICVYLHIQVPLLEREEFRFPCWNMRNSTSLSCLALPGKYFSRNLVLKEVQVRTSSLVCINYSMPTHQYFASTISRKVTKDGFCALVHSITL